MQVNQALTKATLSMIWRTGAQLVASLGPVAVPETEWHDNRQIARDQGEFYLHTVIGR